MTDNGEFSGVEFVFDSCGMRFVNEDGLLLGVRGFFDVVDDEAGEGEGEEQKKPGRELHRGKGKEYDKSETSANTRPWRDRHTISFR